MAIWIPGDPDYKPLVDLINHKATASTKLLSKALPDDSELFVLSPATALETHRLCRKERDNLWHQRSQVYFPYTQMVVEIPITDEIRAMRNAVDAAKGQHHIRRIAAVITVDGKTPNRLFAFSPIWEFDNGHIDAALVTPVFAESEETELFGIQGEDPVARSRFALLPSPAFTAAAVRDGVMPQRFGAVFERLLQTEPHFAYEALEEAGIVLFSWLVILNAKSGVTKTTVAAVRPGARKLGARKKATLSRRGFTMVNLSAVETVAPDTGVIQARKDLQAHWVRGHFKLRSSGVFWWSPFVRGTGEIRKRKGYMVQQ